MANNLKNLIVLFHLSTRVHFKLGTLFDLKPFHFYRNAATERADTIQDFGRFPIEIKAKIGYLISLLLSYFYKA